MKRSLFTCLFLLILCLGTPLHGYAQGGCITGSTGCTSAPEIDPSLTGADAVLLGGIVLLIRGRRRL